MIATVWYVYLIRIKINCSTTIFFFSNFNWFFNVKPYVLEEAEALGVGDIFDDYALGAGVEAEGRKSLQDAYSEIPIEYANQLAALEKKQLEEGLKKKRIQKLLENQYFSQGGIASLKRK